MIGEMALAIEMAPMRWILARRFTRVQPLGNSSAWRRKWRMAVARTCLPRASKPTASRTLHKARIGKGSGIDFCALEQPALVQAEPASTGLGAIWVNAPFSTRAELTQPVPPKRQAHHLWAVLMARIYHVPARNAAVGHLILENLAG